MAQQYGISEQELKVIQIQHARRLANRKEFLKQVYNPYKHAAEAGYVFDPAVTRFMAMKYNKHPYFVATTSSAIRGFAYTILPIIGFSYLVWKERSTREAKIRSGELRYRDRLFKLQ